MIMAQKIKLIHRRNDTPIHHTQIDLPKNSWILSASGLGTPGDYLLVTLNILGDCNAEKETKDFIIILHNNKEIPELQNIYEDLLYLNSFDVGNDTYSVFEVLPREEGV